MKIYIKNGFGYFWDAFRREWVLYPVNENGERVEWDENGEPIEAEYFPNKTDLNIFFKKIKKSK